MNIISNIRSGALAEALSLLPSRMSDARAEAMLLAIGLQESLLIHRRQIGGPARGLWQFERGTAASRGGVWGVFLHPASGSLLKQVAKARGIDLPSPSNLYPALEHDDVLAAAAARLLLWTDPGPLPELGDADAAWALYLRTWRPGAAKRDHDNLRRKFCGNYATACAQLGTANQRQEK